MANIHWQLALNLYDRSTRGFTQQYTHFYMLMGLHVVDWGPDYNQDMKRYIYSV